MPKSRAAVALGAAIMLAVLWTCTEPVGPRDRAGRPEFAGTAGSTEIMLAAGDIADCTQFGDDSTAALIERLLADDPGAAVQTLGDNAYEDATAQDYANCYAPTWGRFKRITRPQIGNHEYNVSVTPTFEYFGDSVFNHNVPGGYYSYDLGDWHIIVLNDNNVKGAINPGSPQMEWLHDDLSHNAKQCTMAIWHSPRFWSTNSTEVGLRSTVYAVWQELYAARVDVILNGHQHMYERMAPQDPDGNATPDGIRQFIVGTGGAKTQPTPRGVISPNSEVRYGGVHQYGVIRLALAPGSYTWEFVPIPGVDFSDTGSASCHGQGANAAPTARTGGPYTGSEGVPTGFDGSASSDPEGQPLTYAWDFGDGAAGTGPAPSHAYAENGTYAVKLVVTDSKGLASAEATTSVTVPEGPPGVEAGEDASVEVGGQFDLSAAVGDGAGDGPWTWSVDWGDQTSSTGSRSSLGTPLAASHTYAAASLNVVRVSVASADGRSGTDSMFVTVGGTTLVGAGTIARCDKTSDEATAKTLDGIPGTVFTLGDNVLTGSADDFNDCYAPTWGRHLSRTRPVAGDKEYLVTGATPYYQYFGAAAGDPSKGYYSYDVGAWHVIVLNSSLSTSASSPQVSWLRADLLANSKPCTMAMWHYPLFSSGASSSRTSIKPLWDVLYQYGTDLVLNGHYAIYERFAPQTPAGAADPARGIREFTVGTGGQNSNSLVRVAENSEVRARSIYGVLKLTLVPNGYTWAYVRSAGAELSDAGSTACH